MSTSYQIDQASLTPESAARAQRDAGVGAVLKVVDDIVDSTDPHVVFASVTRLCVPILCDDATFAIREIAPAIAELKPCLMRDGVAELAAGPASRPRLSVVPPAAEPVGQSAPIITDNSVIVSVAGAAAGGQPGYEGVLALRFFDYRPGSVQAVLAELIVERATSVVSRARLAARLAAETSRADNLQLALASNREIGMAIGVLMFQHKLTSEQAFDLLRRVSQHGHRKLREVAYQVADTGELVLPAGVRIAEHAVLPGSPAR